MDAGPARAPGRSHRLGDLGGVLQHEPRGRLGEPVGAAEGGFQAKLRGLPEMRLEIPHDRDVRAREARNRLPVVADREEAVAGRLVDQGLQEPRACGRDVLELVDQDVGPLAAVAPLLDQPGGAVDHVVEVDRPVLVKDAAVAFRDRPEDREEGLAPLAGARGGDTDGELLV